MPQRFNPGALALIVIGVLFLLSNLGLLDWSEVWKFWPVLLIGTGLLMLIPKKR